MSTTPGSPIPPKERTTSLSAKQRDEIKEYLSNSWALFFPPFISVNYALLRWRSHDHTFWQRPRSVDIVLKPRDGHTITQDDIDRYIQLIKLFYASKGLEIFFATHKALRRYMEDEYDDALASELSKVASGVQCKHTNYLRTEIFDFIRPAPDLDIGFVIPSGSLPKEKRGLENHLTARFLIPRKHLEEFDRDPERIIANYKAGGPGWQLIAEELPTFLYDERAGWNVNNMKKGLLRGHILVRVALRVFRNRTAADDDTLDGWFNPNKPRMGPKCILDRGEYTKITRGIVAYAAVQAYVALSSMPKWGPDDGAFFNFAELYHIVISLLSSNGDKWVTETLDWWQKKIFGEKEPVKRAEGPAKAARATTSTMYQALLADRLEGADGNDEEELEYTYPRWTQRSRPVGRSGNGANSIGATEDNTGHSSGAIERQLSAISIDNAHANEEAGEEPRSPPPIPPPKKQQRSSDLSRPPLRIPSSHPTVVPPAPGTSGRQRQRKARFTLPPADLAPPSNDPPNDPPHPAEHPKPRRRLKRRVDSEEAEDRDSKAEEPAQDEDEDGAPPSKRQRTATLQASGTAPKKTSAAPDEAEEASGGEHGRRARQSSTSGDSGPSSKAQDHAEAQTSGEPDGKGKKRKAAPKEKAVAKEKASTKGKATIKGDKANKKAKTVAKVEVVKRVKKVKIAVKNEAVEEDEVMKDEVVEKGKGVMKGQEVDGAEGSEMGLELEQVPEPELKGRRLRNGRVVKDL